MGDGKAAGSGGGRQQRRLRNYLLDRHFQLKYSGYLMLIAGVLSLALGFILLRTSQAVIAQSHEAVQQGQQVVARGKEVVSESRKVSAVVQMNIVKEYSDSPELLKIFKRKANQQDDRLKKQQDALEAQATALKKQSIDLAHRQHTMFVSLCVILGLLVVGVGLAGIVVTHKVAGPIFKMKRQIREVGEGSLKTPGKLRKGDELVDFFETFNGMVRSLRARREKEVAELESALEKLEGQASSETLSALRALSADMKRPLEG